MKKEFISVLSQEFEDFLTLRESEGHNTRKERGILITLDRYLFSESYPDKNLSSMVIEGWLESLRQEMSINTKIVYISHYRQFATYLTSLGHTAFIPERPMEDKQYTPYIFSEDEQHILVESADLGENFFPYGLKTLILTTASSAFGIQKDLKNVLSRCITPLFLY